MRLGYVALALLAAPHAAVGQQSARPDTVQQHRDSLTRRPIELEAVTITATPVVREEPASAVKLSPVVLRQAPALDAYDLLRQTAGLEVHDQGQGPGFASDASIRGFSSDHSTDIALWVDGVPNNEPVNGHAEGYNDWNLLFPNAVAGVDVIKGPVSALYGNFALAGVVNVHTLERMRGTSFWLEPGSYGHVEGAVLTGYDRGPDGGVFGARLLREGGWRPNSGYTVGQGHARMVQSLSAAATLDGALDLYATRWDSPGFLSDSAFAARRFDLVADSTDGGFKRRAQERLSLKVLASPSMLWRTTAYATQGRWQLYLTIPPEGGAGEGTGSQTEEEDRRYGFGLTSALTWDRGRARVTAGIEGRWDRSDFENWLTTRRARDSAQILVVARQASGAAFLQATEDVGRHLRVSLGGRFDLQDTKVTPRGGTPASAATGVLSPKLGVLYHWPRVGDLYANLARGFRRTDGVITDPELPFITAWAYEAGIKLDRSYGSASLAAFRMDVSNEQTFDPLTNSSTSGGASRRQGVEATLLAYLSRTVTLSADWTLNDATYRRLITEDGDTLSGTRVFNTARYVGIAALEVAPPGGAWRLRASSNVVGPYTPFDEPGTELDPYALFHLSGALRVGAAHLEVGVRNLLDRSYPELRAGGFVSPGQPRAIFAGVRIERNGEGR
jgi:outer membrane receptor protein involved in Fe transport